MLSKSAACTAKSRHSVEAQDGAPQMYKNREELLEYLKMCIELIIIMRQAEILYNYLTTYKGHMVNLKITISTGSSFSTRLVTQRLSSSSTSTKFTTLCTILLGWAQLTKTQMTNNWCGYNWREHNWPTTDVGTSDKQLKWNNWINGGNEEKIA